MRKLSRGFTLIELLIVIGVIGILAAVIMQNFQGVRHKARDGERKSNLSVIRSALELYRSDVGSYPEQTMPFANPLTDVLGCNIAFTGGGPPTNTYMTKVPCDPLDPTFTYFYNATGVAPSTYTMWGCLENLNDKDRDDDDGGADDLCPTTGRVSFRLQNI